jgi:hypothetical protein
MTRVLDDFNVNEEKFSKHAAFRHIIKSSKLQNSVDGKYYNYVLISFIKFGVESTALGSEVFLC